MAKADDRRWRDWRTHRGAPLRDAKRCPCGTPFSPAIPQQRLCFTCASEEAAAERETLRAVEADEGDDYDAHMAVRRAESAAGLPRPMEADARRERRKARRKARRKGPRPTPAPVRLSGPTGAKTLTWAWAPVARRKHREGMPIRKIAKLLDVSPKEVRKVLP